MKPELRRVGNCQAPVVVIDDFSGDAEGLVAIAQALAPYDDAGNYYPGLRRIITEADEAANLYVERTCEAAAQFVAGAFDVDGFDLVEASFSMVTADPAELRPAQRAPHFDSTDQKYFALLHYVRVPEGSGVDGVQRADAEGRERHPIGPRHGHRRVDVEPARFERRTCGAELGPGRRIA